MNTNEEIYKAYVRSGWTHDRFFERLSKDCLADGICITRSAYDSWKKSGDAAAFRQAPIEVALVARNIDPEGDELQARYLRFVETLESASKQQLVDLLNVIVEKEDDYATRMDERHLHKTLRPLLRKRLREYA